MCQARQRPQGILCVLPRAITKHGANPAGKIHSGLLEKSISQTAGAASMDRSRGAAFQNAPAVFGGCIVSTIMSNARKSSEIERFRNFSFLCLAIVQAQYFARRPSEQPFRTGIAPGSMDCSWEFLLFFYKLCDMIKEGFCIDYGDPHSSERKKETRRRQIWVSSLR